MDKPKNLKLSASDMHRHHKRSLQTTWFSANLDFVTREGNKAVYLRS